MDKNFSKCLGKIILGREKVQTNKESALCIWGRTRRPMVSAWCRDDNISFSDYLVAIYSTSTICKTNAIKNIDTTYTETWQNWDIHETHKTFFDFSFMTPSCRKYPSSDFAYKARKFWWGQLEPSHYDTTVWLSNHCQFLLLAYLTAANFTTTLIFQPICLFIISFPGLCQRYL